MKKFGELEEKIESINEKTNEIEISLEMVRLLKDIKEELKNLNKNIILFSK